MHSNNRWDSFVTDHLRKSTNVTCLKQHYPHHCDFCPYVGTSYSGLEKHYDHPSNVICYTMRSQAREPDILDPSAMTILTDHHIDNCDHGLDSDQIDFISAAQETADANIGEQMIVFDGSNRLRKTKDSREIMVVIFENANESITDGATAQHKHNSALTKNVIRNHIQSQRDIVKNLKLSKLSRLENTTLRSLPGLAVNPKSTQTILDVDEVSVGDEDEDSVMDDDTFVPMEIAEVEPDQEMGNVNATAPVLRLPAVDITVSSKNASRHQDNIRFGPDDHASIDLFLLLQKSNAPLILFDRIVDWVNVHKNSLANGLDKRKKTVNTMMQKLYHKDVSPLPQQVNLKLSSGRTTSITKFSLLSSIQEMITNKSLMTPDNLLLNVNAPWETPPMSGFLDEPNSGTWYQTAMKECHERFGERSLVLNMSFFIDELKIDKFGKLGSECVLGNWLWFKRSVRNVKKSWFPLGFIEDQKRFSNTKDYTVEAKMQDYHDMVACIFQEMKEIQQRGGILCDLDFGDGLVHKDVIIYPDIQAAIGDCKGNDVQCGRKPTHSLQTPWLVRDCNVPSMQGDQTDFQCVWTEKRHIQNKTKEELASMSDYSIKNAFHSITFSWCPRNIHGNSPPELLHQIQLGICNDLGKDLSFTDKGNLAISKTFDSIYPYACCQSDRQMPSVHPFRHGISSVKSLKAKERFCRVFAVYLCFMNSFCIEKLLRVQKKGGNGRENNSLALLRGYLLALEETLCLHTWLKQESVSQADLEPPRTSKVEMRIEQFYSIFQKNVVLDGNKFKKPKSHQLKHIADIMRRHGVPSNIDGSRGEYFGLIFVKNHAKLTNKDRDTLSLDISTRYAETKCMEKLNELREEQGLFTNLKFLNSSTDVIGKKPGVSTTNKRFTLQFFDEIEVAVPHNIHHERILVEWVSCKPPVKEFCPQLLHSVCVRLFQHVAFLGGRVKHQSKIPGFTDLKRDGVIFRANPYFRKKGEWFDWAYFNWEGHDEPVPARILMFLDLTNVEIIVEETALSRNMDEIDVGPEESFILLTNEVWCVVLAAKESTIDQSSDNLSDAHFDSLLSDRIELESKYRLVPASSITAPAFVIMNECCNGEENPVEVDRSTAVVVKAMSKWPDLFVP